VKVLQRAAFGIVLGLGALSLLIVAGCGSASPTPPPSVAATDPPTGGTLRVAMDLASYEAADVDGGPDVNTSWDPARAWQQDPFEVFRCCLVRNLLSYNGRSLHLGGAVLQPDLAAQMPTISADGLTWTFRLKTGIHYAPPMADKQIVAGDFVRSFERALRPDPLAEQPSSSYGAFATLLSSVIAGGADFANGTATSISGLETPDDQTLAIHLLAPTGDLGARLALPAFAPIPPGAADGHDKDYGRYLVASGPYMIEGSDQLDPSLPPDQQPAVSGYVPGDHVYLVRNPSWDRATDPLRSAFADRIELTNMPDHDTVMSAIENGQIDLSLSDNLSGTDIANLRADPASSGRLHVTGGLTSYYIQLNLAVPPFDDIHVRTAVQLATDKRAIVANIAPDDTVQNHALPDTFENGLLTSYAPFETAGDSGDLAAAKAEMAQSAYDSNHDGICDSSACQSINVPWRDDPGSQAGGTVFAADLAGIGIELQMTAPDPNVGFFNTVGDPSTHSPLAFNVGWETNYLGADSWFDPMATGAQIGQQNSTGFNVSMIGATPAQLGQYGYVTAAVPSLDSNIAGCNQLAGADAFGCWAGVDQYMMQRVAAWIPLANNQVARLVSASVTGFDFDASLAEPSLAQIQVAE
jgi:peptide/nickel transport system substrate-binding protein